MRLPLTLLAATILAGPALAHGEAAAGGGLLTGFLHPLLGWDHVAAMVAVGLWGAVLGRPALWVLPLVFPLVMATGAALGIAGVAIPQVETGIALSGVVLGLLVALLVRTPLWVAGVVVGAFAVFHGHAHGTELPHGIGAAPYALGFVAGTGLLHGAGIALGILMGVPRGPVAVRAAGAAIAAAGFAFLTGVA